jgi:hypothetical protein
MGYQMMGNLIFWAPLLFPPQIVGLGILPEIIWISNNCFVGLWCEITNN